MPLDKTFVHNCRTRPTCTVKWVPSRKVACIARALYQNSGAMRFWVIMVSRHALSLRAKNPECYIRVHYYHWQCIITVCNKQTQCFWDYIHVIMDVLNANIWASFMMYIKWPIELNKTEIQTIGY